MSQKKDSLDELNQQLNGHFQMILKCTAEHPQHGRLLLASPPDTRYPYIYPRDSSCAVQLFRRVAGSSRGYDAAGQAFELTGYMAGFLKSVQAPDGSWGQRYSLQGENKSIYKQEDNTAHGIAILCNYLLTTHRLEKDIPEAEEYLAAIDRAMNHAISKYYEKELNLFYSTTSIHESAMEEGYTCWVNMAYLYAFYLAEEVAALFDHGKIISRKNLGFYKQFNYSINELFMSGERYVRRIDPGGNMDMRPDFSLLSPFYSRFITCGSVTSIDFYLRGLAVSEKCNCHKQRNSNY